MSGARQVVPLVLGLMLPVNVAAHGGSAERGVVVQLDKQGGALLWRVTMRGRPAMLMAAPQDRDGDGALRGEEGRRLAITILAKASRDFRLQWEGEPLATRAVEARLEGPAQVGDALTVVGLMQFALPAGAVQGTLAASLTGPEGVVSLQVQGLDGWRLVTTSAGQIDADGQGLTRAVALGRQRAQHFVMKRPPPTGEPGK